MAKKNERNHLIKLYEEALKNLIYKFEKLLKEGRKVDYETYLLKELKKSFEEIKEQKKIIQMTLNDEYLNRKIAEIEKAIRIANVDMKYNYKQFTKIDTENIIELYGIFNERTNRAAKGIGKQIQKFFTKEQQKATSELNSIVKDELILRHLGKSKDEVIVSICERLKDNLYFILRTDTGKRLKMSLPAYAKMNLNTMFQQAKNAATIQAVKETKSNLVRFSRHYWTCETCTKYAEGRIYSLDRRIKKYPYLYDIPGFNMGYKSIHPNCKHLLSGYYEEGHNQKEIEENKKLSNNQSDTRSPEMIKKYEMKQEINRLERVKNSINAKLQTLRGANLTEEERGMISVLNRRKKEIIKKINSLRDNFRGL